jgi:hypothetical protein
LNVVKKKLNDEKKEAQLLCCRGTEVTMLAGKGSIGVFFGSQSGGRKFGLLLLPHALTFGMRRGAI